MGSHQSDRRQFLTESAALASLAVGAVQSVGAQAPQPDARLKDPLAYGQPSRFDNTVRKSLGVRHSHHRHGVDDPASGSRRDHHALRPALPDGPRQRPPGHRPAAASPADARHGRSSADVHDGRIEAVPVRLEDLLPRVQREQPPASWSERRFSATRTWTNELQRVDRGVVVGSPQRVRRAERGELDHRRGE